MKLNELSSLINAEILNPGINDDKEITQGYVSDLLSDVLAHAPAGGVLITVQVHLNVIAVAVHAELSAVIFALGRRPEDHVIEKAINEKIALLVTDENAFDVVGKLYHAGTKGPQP
jgi:hypothetical protein